MKRSFCLFACSMVAVLVFTTSPSSISAQTPSDDVSALTKRVTALEDELRLIRGQLDSIRDLSFPKQSALAPDTALHVEGASIIGEKTAKLAVVEFSDYKCPFCKISFNRDIPRLTTQYIRTGRVRYLVRDFPLHAESLLAAEAAHCAGDQGKFWLMHDGMMAGPDAIDRKILSVDAQNFDLDIASFDKCLDMGKYSQEVQAEMAQGIKMGVAGTPTFLLGTIDAKGETVTIVQKIDGAVPFSTLQHAIDGLLANQK
jgi:protein-disulfide isomerase